MMNRNHVTGWDHIVKSGGCLWLPCIVKPLNAAVGDNFWAIPRVSSNQFLNHFPRLNTCQSLIQSLILVSELFVVDAQKAKHRRMEVVDVYGIFHDVVGEIIGFAVDRAALGRRRRPSTS